MEVLEIIVAKMKNAFDELIIDLTQLRGKKISKLEDMSIEITKLKHREKQTNNNNKKNR